ncbi:pre-mRNA polyadenylation factor FIP1-like [Salvia miltiorrhiza]|uniref:pre-mRNA polyadenylation factor FIP1-like n=1 Tax=Salvia miltiorrhiza TaxID=226208 RepID=UPI0025AB7A3E|nr:pre-mRNA polyadenylation factor FIP1-like [Salvia miltiorrhiza]
MEADEEEGELCAEKWKTPTPIYSNQNPKIWTSKQRDIIPVLVADTFYDKVLRHATDGIDIPALLNIPPKPTAAQSKRLCATKTEFSQRDFVRKLGVMLYSNKAINFDDFEEKMWRNPGADATDFFNYGLDEKQWKDYCKEMHALIHGRVQDQLQQIEVSTLLLLF